MKTIRKSQGTGVTREWKKKQYLWAKATSIHVMPNFWLSSKDMEKEVPDFEEGEG